MSTLFLSSLYIMLEFEDIGPNSGCSLRNHCMRPRNSRKIGSHALVLTNPQFEESQKQRSDPRAVLTAAGVERQRE